MSLRDEPETEPQRMERIQRMLLKSRQKLRRDLAEDMPNMMERIMHRKLTKEEKQKLRGVAQEMTLEQN